MLRASLKSLMARKLRLFMSAFAIILGVAFVAGTLIFTDTLSKTFTGIMEGSVGDVVVRPVGSASDDSAQTTKTLPASLADRLDGVQGAARVDGNVSNFGTFVVGPDGKVVGGQGAPGLGLNYTDAPAATGEQAVTVVDGRAPGGPGEVALDTHTAEQAGYTVGDTVQLVTSGDRPRLSARLVGTVEFSGGGTAGASLTMFDTDVAQRLYLGGKDAFTDIWVTGKDGVSQDELRDAVAADLPEGVEAVTGGTAADEAASDVNQALSFITTFLLVFAGVSLFVGSFLIINTFSILVAQRSRELALLRAIGARRGQLTRSVLLEAAVVGLLGGTVGLGLGFALASGIKALFASFGLDLSQSGLVFEPRTAVVAYAVGLLVTLLAAYLPARRAGRIPPVAAMRDDVAMSEGSLHRRVGVGVGLVVLGTVALALGLFGSLDHGVWYVGAGIFGVVLGVALTSPVVGRPVIALVGLVYRRLFGTVGRMAEQNAVRNPRRTAATASALMIGLTLVSMMAVIGQSAKASVDKVIAENFAADYVISNAVGVPFSPTIARDAEQVPGVEAAAPFRYARGAVGGEDQLLGATTTDMDRVVGLDMVSGSFGDLGPGRVVLDEDTATALDLTADDSTSLTIAGKTRPVTVAGVFASTPAVPTSAIVSTTQLARAGIAPADSAVFVLKDPSASSASVRSGLEDAVAGIPTVTLKDQAAFAEEQRAPIDQLLFLIYALLGLAVVIAVLGIVNTLALSVLERTREIGLLRAVGLSRRQLKRMVRLEAVVIAVLGAALGVGLGILFGVALQRSLADDGVEVLSVPVVWLLLCLVVAAVVGVLAAAWPARRASRLDVLTAIATE